MFTSNNIHSMYQRWRRLLDLIWIGLFLVSLAACSSPQDTRAEPVSTSNATPGLEITGQSLSTPLPQTSEPTDVLVPTLETQTAIQTSTPLPQTIELPTARPTAPPEVPPSTIPNLPDDIPLTPGERLELFTSSSLITYLTQTDFTQLVLFFENQMPINDWIRQSTGSFITDGSALLNFTKDKRKVSISVRSNPITGLTAIVITLQ
jgi:hypothetical protein